MRPIVSLIFLAALAGCSSHNPLTICKADSEGLLVDGKRLNLSAVYSTDGMQVAFFRNNDCPEIRVGLIFDGQHKSLGDFENTIARYSGIGKPLQRYDLVVSGVFRENYGATGRVLIVDRIQSAEKIE